MRNLIEVLNILTYNDNNGNCNLSLHKGLVTRRHRYKSYQKHVNYDMTKYFFAHNVISILHMLPDNVVSSTSTNMFKYSLDKLCTHRMFIST